MSGRSGGAAGVQADAQSKRTYRSPRRQQQAAETRRVVLAAATALFEERGWPGTAVRDVAREAGVSVETVYANFPSKGDLLLTAVDVAVVGDDEPVPLAERAEFAAVALGDRDARAQAGARLTAAIHRRTARLYRALHQAAAADAELAARLAHDEELRRESVGQAAALVAGRPLTRTERDGLWALLSWEVYDLLTGNSGWSIEQYEAWVAGVVLRLLDEGTES